MIKVLLFGELEGLANTPDMFVPLKDCNVLELLAELSVICGKRFRDIVLGDDPETGVIILINDKPVRRSVMEKLLYDGDVVSLMPLSRRFF